MENKREMRNSLVKRCPGLRKFYISWRILLWKAVLMRIDSPITTILELVVPIVFSLQIRLMFEPLALNIQNLDRYTKDDILSKFSTETQCWYVPKDAFIDDLMSRVSKKLRTKIQPADTESSLVKSYFSKNRTSSVLWAIFDIDSNSSKPKFLKYKIRSSKIGESSMIMLHEEEPVAKDPYISSGFIALQIAIERSFVEMWENPTLPRIGYDVNIGRYPYYKVDFLIMPSMVRPSISVIYYMIVVAFIPLPIATLQKIMHDKETGFRELMKLMNMPFAVLYIGWFNHLMITALPITIVCTILLSPVFSNSYAVVVATFILLYVSLSALFMFALATFFRNSTKALLTSLLFWLFLTHFTIVLDQSLVRASLTSRIASLILPHTGLLYGLVSFTSRMDLETHQSEAAKRLINKSEYNQIPSYLWPKKISELLMLRDVHDIVHATEKISIGIILTAWSFHILLWYLLTIYLDNINPGQFESAKPWYYLCKKTSRDVNAELTFRGSTNWSAVEKTPSFLKPSVRVRCVTKKFGRMGERVIGLKDVTIAFYKQEFSVILGHNGAGKSCLLKIIIGMYKPTHGQVYLEGIDYGEDESTADPIGYCPQENILVNYMTIMQHLYICGMMKGLTYKEANSQALSLLQKLSLESVKDSKPSACSFGTQRRVCLAMALIGHTQILVLDEPTYGIDPEHRRQIWDLLLDIKKTKTILMATNSMEAADILADRIAIIANGKVECYGSKMYLNRRYRIGYILSLVIHDGCDLERLRSQIQEFSSEPIALRSAMGKVMRFDMPRSSRFTKLLQYMESNKEELGIDTLLLSVASIESQILRIGLASQYKERSLEYPSSKYELIVQQRRRRLLQSEKTWTRISGAALRHQQIFMMFYKKFLHVISTWRLYIFSISLAIVSLILSTMISEISNYPLFEVTEKVMNLTNYVDNNLHALYYAADAKSAQDFLVVLCATAKVYSVGPNYHISKNITATDLMIHPDLHSIEFRDRYVMSVDVLSDGRIDLMYSSTAVHSGPIALNLLHNAILRYHCAPDDCWIKLSSRPLMDPRQWQHLLIHPRSVRNWENAAVVMTLFLLLPTIDLGTKELSSLSKMLQVNTLGVTTLIYWIPMYIVDLLIYAFSLVLLLIVILVAYRGIAEFSALEIVQVYTIFACYGACAIPLGYCIQLVAKKTEKVYFTMMIINAIVVLLVNGSIIFPLAFRVLTDKGKYFFEALLHVLPPYVLACALSNYLMLNLYNRRCSYFNTCDTEFCIEDPCCQNCEDKGHYKPLSIMLIKQSGGAYHHAVIDDIFLLISQALAFHLVLEIFEEKNRRKWYTYFTNTINNHGPMMTDVLEEKLKVEEHMKHYEETASLPSQVALVVQNLTKTYGKKTIVKGVNFNINRQECFGLLGLNGAGKSSIFKALTGQCRMSHGKAVMFDYEFAKNQDKFIGMIGYCPQTGGLSDFMTGRQHLQLHAALRGVPFENITDEVNKWLDVLDLLDFENLKIKYCPWGVQRKICILQSLIGDLPMVFMDEPSSGIDIMSRLTICDMLHQVQEMGRSLLFTTHNMQEAEAMCLRVGILADGQFVAIGSCEQLKEKHGSNFVMSIGIAPGYQVGNIEAVKRLIDETFPGVKFKDSHLGVLKYELERDIPYSNVFDELDTLRKKHPWITDFSINQPSMDQVFLDVAKKQKQPSQEVPSRNRFRAWLQRFIRRT